MIAADIEALAVASTITFVVGAALGSTQRYLKGRGSDALADRRLRKHGDHIALASPFATSLDNRSGTCLVAGVAAAPSMTLRRPVTLDADRVDEWRRSLPVAAALTRDYLNPDELIRYRAEDVDNPGQLVITPAGLIDTVQSVGHQRDANGHPALDLASFVSAIVLPVVAISDGAHRLLFDDQLRTNRLDWRISLSRQVHVTHDVYGSEPAQPWRSIVFPKSTPSGATVGQQAPMNHEGLAADQLRNIAVKTRPETIVTASVRSLLMRSGYSGIDDVMVELGDSIEQEIAIYRRSLP